MFYMEYMIPKEIISKPTTIVFIVIDAINNGHIQNMEVGTLKLVVGHTNHPKTIISSYFALN